MKKSRLRPARSAAIGPSRALLTISAFEVEVDKIVAVGVLKGLLTDGGVQTRAEQAVRLPLDKVTDAFASAGSAGVETLAGGSFDLVFLNMVVQILAAAFTLAPFDLKIPITKSKKQQKIIARSTPPGTLRVPPRRTSPPRSRSWSAPTRPTGSAISS